LLVLTNDITGRRAEISIYYANIDVHDIAILILHMKSFVLRKIKKLYQKQEHSLSYSGSEPPHHSMQSI
jgi:hypothetical protein